VHDGVHQGGPIAASAITGPHDSADWYRSTGHTTAFATTGVGLELYYDTTGNRGMVQTRNAATGTYNDTAVIGNTVTLAVPSGAAVILGSDGNFEISQAIILGSSQAAPVDITWRSANTAGIANLIVDGILTVPTLTLTTGLTTPNATVSTLTVTGTLTNSGATNLSNTTVNGTLTATGALSSGAATVNGILTVGSATLSGNATNLLTGDSLIIGGGAILYLGADKSVHINRGTGQITFSHLVSAPGVTSTSDVNVTGNIAVSGQIQPGGAGAGIIVGQAGTGNVEINSTLTVNTANANSKVFFVNGAAGGTTTWAQVSTRKYKQDIEPIANPLEFVMDDRLHGIVYTPTKEIASASDAASERYGFEVEAWYAVAPQVVQLDRDQQPVSMGYAEVGAITWEGLKQLAGQVQALNGRLTALEAA
jgi:hypothetical protein